MEDIFSLIFILGAALVVFGVGLTVGLRYNYDTRLAELGINRRSAGLYVRAFNLFTSIEEKAMWDEFTREHPMTGRRVAEWVADARGVGVSRTARR